MSTLDERIAAAEPLLKSIVSISGKREGEHGYFVLGSEWRIIAECYDREICEFLLVARDLIAERAELKARVERFACICYGGPSPEPSEDCPQHGMTYADMQRRLSGNARTINALRTEVELLREVESGSRTVGNDHLNNIQRRALVKLDALRSQEPKPDMCRCGHRFDLHDGMWCCVAQCGCQHMTKGLP